MVPCGLERHGRKMLTQMLYSEWVVLVNLYMLLIVCEASFDQVMCSEKKKINAIFR